MKDGGSAFPFTTLEKGPTGISLYAPSHGMTLRQWYIGMSLMGQRANPDYSHLKPGAIAASAAADADACLREDEEASRE